MLKYEEGLPIIRPLPLALKNRGRNGFSRHAVGGVKLAAGYKALGQATDGLSGLHLQKVSWGPRLKYKVLIVGTRRAIRCEEQCGRDRTSSKRPVGPLSLRKP